MAIIGPFAKATVENHGFWSIAFPDDSQRIVTQFDGIKAQLDKNSELLYAKGCNANDNDKSLFAEAVETAKKADSSDYDFRRRSRNEWRSKSRSNIHFLEFKKIY